MHSRIEDNKVVITLDLSVAYDSDTGGHTVIEKDGPPDLNHEIRWGPMPHHLVEAFISERAECIRKTVAHLLPRMRLDQHI